MFDLHHSSVQILKDRFHAHFRGYPFGMVVGELPKASFLTLRDLICRGNCSGSEIRYQIHQILDTGPSRMRLSLLQARGTGPIYLPKAPV